MRKLLFKKSRGLSLVEILVAVSVFSTVGLMALTVFVNITRIQGRLALENAIYEDARFMMERISRSIRNNAVDYEEYFNKSLNAANEYGALHGCYAAQFYNPGVGDATNLDASPGKLGAYCNNKAPYTGQECTVYKPSIDINTGRYPYQGVTPAGDEVASSNAFCPLFSNAALGCKPQLSQTKSELYLINQDGSIKTFFARKKVGNDPAEYALAMLEKIGEDANGDGVVEKWKGCSNSNTFCCPTEYDCRDFPQNVNTLEQSLANGTAANIYKGFVPISPLRSNITRLDFEIRPTEDPRKAFAEDASKITQPSVRVTMTVQPSKAQLNRFGNPPADQIPTIILQTTISSRMQSEVKSYLGAATHNIAGCPLPTQP